jgi:hypothetical protein
MSILWRKKKDYEGKATSMKAAGKEETEDVKKQPYKRLKTDDHLPPKWIRQWKV